MIDWESSFARSLGFYTNFDTMSPHPFASGRQIVQDKVTGVVANPIQFASDTVESGEIFDLGVCLSFPTDLPGDGVPFGAAGTFGTLTDIARYCKSDSVYTCAAKFNTAFNTAIPKDIIGQNTQSGTGTWGLQISGTGAAMFSTADVDIAATSSSYATGQWFILFGTHLPTVGSGGTNSIRIYDTFGGLLETVSVSTTVSPATATTEPISIGQPAAGSSQSFHGFIEWCGIWKRNLEANEMALLASDPYQMLLPPGNNRRIGGKVVVSATNPRFRALTGVGK